MSVNKVIVLGNLCADPEIKYTPNGNAVCNMRVATSEKWKDQSGKLQEKSEFHRIVVFGKLAELCGQYLNKGRQAYVEGKIATRSYDNKDGIKVYMTEIIASTVQFIGKNDTPKEEPVQQEYSISSDASFSGDDIPF